MSTPINEVQIGEEILGSMAVEMGGAITMEVGVIRITEIMIVAALQILMEEVHMGILTDLMEGDLWVLQYKGLPRLLHLL